MKKLKNKILLILCFFITDLVAQDTLNYNSFIEEIKRNYPLYAKSTNISAAGTLQYKAARGAYDPVLTGAYDNKFYDARNYFTTVDSKIKQPLFTSQYITTGYQYAQGSFLNPENKTSASGLPFLGVEASLLQGLLIDKRRAEVLKAKQYKAYYDAESKGIANDIFLNASFNYFEWVFSCKELSLYNYFTVLALQRLNAIKALAGVGEYAGIDSIEASILYQTRYLDMQSIQIENKKTETDLLSYNWKDQNTAASIGSSLLLKDSLEYYFDRSKRMLAQLFLDTVINNPVLAKYQALQGVLKIEQRYKAELIKPRLDVNYNFLAPNSETLNTNFNTNNYKWGFNVAFPLFMRSSRNDYKIAKLNSDNNSLETKTKANELSFKFNFIRQNLAILLEQLITAEKNSKYSKMLLFAEKSKFEQGESTLFLLNTRESKWLEAELKLAQYKAKFIKLVIEAIYIKGDLNYEM